MSKVLTNGIIIPDNGSRNWGGDLANNWNILDVNVGYMTDVKNRVTTLENSVAENSANIQINASNISALQTSKQDKIEDLETIREGASSGATAVQPNALSNYVDLSSEQTITGAKTFSGGVNTVSLNGKTPAYADDLATKANDSDVVHKSGNESINGTKTFGDDIRISKTSPFVNAFASGYIKGQTPTSNIYSGVRFFDDINNGSANSITGGFEIKYDTTGYTIASINARTYVNNSQLWRSINLRIPNDSTRSIDFYPASNSEINLGTSTNKWKTINGINPGALSLPSDTSITIDTTDFKWDANFTFTPSVNGYLFISIANSAGTRKLSMKSGRGEYYFSNQIGILRFTFPVYKDKLVTILATSTTAETVVPNLTIFSLQGNI